MSFDVASIRTQFPILSRQVHGRPLVYLDSAASAQKPEPVIEAMQDAMRRSYANVHRGLHALANVTTEAYEGARARIARFINAPSPDCVVFTKGATHAINIVAAGLKVSQGDEIILSAMEHHSNIVPWHFLRERNGAVLKWLEVDADGGVDLIAFERLLSARTRMVAITHMSNVLGAATPVAEMARLAHAAGAQILVDGCQSVVHAPVDVRALDVDYFAFSGHKLYGPTGIGVLYGKPDRLEALDPFEGGGEMIEIVTQDRVTYNAPPHKFEAGTPPIVEAIGLGAALDWLEGLDRAAVARHELGLLERLMAGLRDMNNVKVYGQAAGKGPIAAFNLSGAHPHDVAQILDRHGVAIRAGHHCAQPLMTRLGVTATARASIGVYSTEHDIDQFIEALHKARRMLG